MGTKCRALARAAMALAGIILAEATPAHADQTLDTVLKRGKLVHYPIRKHIDAEGRPAHRAAVAAAKEAAQGRIKFAMECFHWVSVVLSGNSCWQHLYAPFLQHH